MNKINKIVTVLAVIVGCMIAFFMLFQAMAPKADKKYVTNYDFSADNVWAADSIRDEIINTVASIEMSFESIDTTVVYMPENEAAATKSVAQSGTLIGADLRIAECLTLINNERVKRGIKPYTWDADLAKAADIRAKEAQVSWSHTRPNGTQYYTVCDSVMAENLGDGFDDDTAEAFYTAWMLSPSHRENLMESRLTTIGMSVYVVDGHIYWAQEFGY